MGHKTSSEPWETYSQTLSQATCMGLLVSVPTMLPSLVCSIRGQRGDSRYLLPCVSTPPHISLPSPPQGPHHVSGSPPGVVAPISFQDLRTFEVVVLQFHELFPLMPTLVFIQVAMLCFLTLVLSQTCVGIINPCMDGTTLLIPPKARCLTLSLWQCAEVGVGRGQSTLKKSIF